MYNNSSHLFVNNKRNKSNFKLYSSILLFVLIIVSVIIYEFFSYKLLVRNFTYYFDEKKFSNANNIVLTTENLNPFKAILLEKDLSQYFNDKLDYLSEAISDEDISLNDALDITKEISLVQIIMTLIKAYPYLIHRNMPRHMIHLIKLILVTLNIKMLYPI